MRMSHIPGCYCCRSVEVLAALTLATAEFERRLAVVTPSRWQAPTPAKSGPCAISPGQIPGQRFAGLRIDDLVVHAWDIARAVGADENLDEELVREAYTVYEPMAEGFLDSGAFGSGPRFTADDLSPQSRLLHLLGRRP